MSEIEAAAALCTSLKSDLETLQAGSSSAPMAPRAEVSGSAKETSQHSDGDFEALAAQLEALKADCAQKDLDLLSKDQALQQVTDQPGSSPGPLIELHPASKGHKLVVNAKLTLHDGTSADATTSEATARLEAQLGELQTQLNEANLQNEVLRTAGQMYKKGSGKAAAEEGANKAAELEGLVAELREKLSGAEGKLADANAQNETLKAEHAEAVGKMESELSDVKAQLAAALAELEALKSERDGLLKEVEALKAGHSEGESAQQEALEQQRKLYELEQAVNSALVSHRGELSKEFGALATQKSEYDNSKKGKKKGVAERVAKDLGDLLEETKKE